MIDTSRPALYLAALRGEPVEHETLPPPVERLPKLIRRFVEEGAATRGIPPDFITTPLLAMVAAIVGTKYCLQVKRGWVEFPALWTGVVGRPGTGKSAGHDYARGALESVQNRYRAEWVERRRQWEELPRDERKTTPEPARMPSVYTTDATAEAVAEMLTRRTGLLLEREELAGWAASFDAYRQAGDRQLYLSSWSFAPWKTDRKSTGTIYIPRPVVSVTGGVQPERLADLRGGTVDDGFADRFLLSYPAARPVRYTDAEDDPVVVGAVHKLFHWLDCGSTAPDAESPTTTIVMTTQAQELFRCFVNENASALDDASDGLARGWAAKAPRHLARIALVLHLLGETNPADSLRFDTMDASIVWVEYFRHHFLRCLPLLGAAGTSRSVGDVVRVRRYLAGAGGLPLSRSELMNRTRLSSERLTAALEALERTREARRITKETGARPREDWCLCDAGYSEDSENSEEPGGPAVEPAGFSEFPEYSERGGPSYVDYGDGEAEP